MLVHDMRLSRGAELNIPKELLKDASKEGYRPDGPALFRRRLGRIGLENASGVIRSASHCDGWSCSLLGMSWWEDVEGGRRDDFGIV